MAQKASYPKGCRTQTQVNIGYYPRHVKRDANLRFGPGETMETRVFARLSAWQNWIFVRPNAVGEAGALKVFGTGNKARFDRERV